MSTKKIIELSIENVKRIQALTITPNGDHVILGGQNEQGKTSTLDAITMALSGGKKIPDIPIRKGQKHARVEIDLGDMIVERRFSKSGSTLEVRPKDGGPKFSSPQAMLDKLFGNLSFDPLVFTAMKPADQLKTLKEIVGVDLSDLDAKREEIYTERSLVNREIKLAEGRIATMPKYPEAGQSVDTQSLLAELKKAEQQNKAAEQAEREMQSCTTQIEQYDAELDRMRVRAAEIKKAQAELVEKRASFAENAIEPIDTSTITDQLVNAEELNEKVAANEARKKAESELRAKTFESEKLTQAIQDIDNQKEQRLAEAKFPVQGLSFSEDGVLLNGLPFEQASEEQQIVVSAAMGLALRPELRVLLIRKAALLDDKHLSALLAWANEHDAQLWIERVGEGKECTVILEDGMVAEERQVA